MMKNFPDFCIITMAGLGSRFIKAGFSRPKYEIEVNGKTLFEWSMLSLTPIFSKSHFIFISLMDNNSREFITANCKSMRIDNFSIIELSKITEGQAQTAACAVQLIDNNSSVLIFNIDTYIESPFLCNSINYDADGDIICFEAEGNHWSFVIKDKRDNAVLVKEKERISNNCSVGAYYFKMFGDYLRAYSKSLKTKNELYIAPLYNFLINENKQISCSMIDSSKVHVLGTPEEVSFFRRRY